MDKQNRGYRLRLYCLALLLLAVCWLPGCLGKHSFTRKGGQQETALQAERNQTGQGDSSGEGDQQAGESERQEKASDQQTGASGRQTGASDQQMGASGQRGESPGQSEKAFGQPARFDILEEPSEPLPRKYDGRVQGRTSPVKDQGELGTCWAFASMLSLENALLPEEAWDFSEDHMSHDPSFHLGQENGGEYTMSMAYLLSWQGPVTEEQDPYGDGFSPENLKAVKHVQQVQVLPEHDMESIKRAVMNYGGVQSSMYTTVRSEADQSQYYNREAAAYCYPEETSPNHDVVIVGWDDDFPKELFPIEVPGHGAFICENSWGPLFGDGGFFYVSYYDGNLGKYSVAYSGIEAPDNYDRIYQSDLCGWTGQLGYGEETAWAANVYEARSEEQLEAVGFYTVDQATEYEIYVLPQVSRMPADDGFGGRRAMVKGTIANAGFYTVPLPETVALEPGERFAVIVRLTTPGAVHPVAVEYDTGDGKCRIDLTDGEGYISPDGSQWERVEESQNCNLCLKAYTKER